LITKIHLSREARSGARTPLAKQLSFLRRLGTTASIQELLLGSNRSDGAKRKGRRIVT
jgi:hypothetical protein